MKAVVFGASGYGGQVLMRLLMGHPGVEKVLPVSSSSAGSAIDLRDGGLGPDPLGKLPPGRRLLTRDEALAEAPDAVFSALPHGASAEFCRPFFGKSVVFDLSADFRLRGADVHAAAYGQAAPFPELRSSAVYGLSEWYADDIRGADIIAVPGCYPTCSLLPLLPLAKAGLLGSSSREFPFCGACRKHCGLQSRNQSPPQSGDGAGAAGQRRGGVCVFYSAPCSHAPGYGSHYYRCA